LTVAWLPDSAMGIDAGFDLVPRLTKSAADTLKWKQFMTIIQIEYEDDDQVQSTDHCVEFHAGEHPKLPFEGHRFLRFSSKISGRIATETGVERYIRNVVAIAKAIFGIHVHYWNEGADQYGFYNWLDVHASIRSFCQVCQ
jgi:hypothetical protein